MGDPLSRKSLESFSDELQKLAAAGDFLRQAGKFVTSRFRNPSTPLRALGRLGKITRGVFSGGDEALRRIAHPIQGLREGWRASSPLHDLQQRATELGHGSVQEAATALKAKGDPKAYADFLGGGEHLLGTKSGTGRIQSLAEDLSRRGWTGAGSTKGLGRVTKYLPVGNKSLSVGLTGMAIPDIVNAPEPTPTGEGGALETGIGELGGMLGMIAGTGKVGLVPGAAMWYGGRKLSGRLGRVLDRVRAGSSWGDAVSAPSPEEAASQLQSIQKYYG